MRLLPALMIVMAALAGCGDTGDDNARIGGITADDAQQLNDAAAMLDVDERPALPANTQAP